MSEGGMLRALARVLVRWVDACLDWVEEELHLEGYLWHGCPCILGQPSVMTLRVSRRPVDGVPRGGGKLPC